jgi:hypothetical protein
MIMNSFAHIAPETVHDHEDLRLTYVQNAAASSQPPQASLDRAPLGSPPPASMIMGSFDGIATENAHDHAVAPAVQSWGFEDDPFLEPLMFLRPK